jgi:exo-beta-1,3-glucanase (GH17 family)
VKERSLYRNFVKLGILVVVCLNFSCCDKKNAPTGGLDDQDPLPILEEKLSSLCWIAYAPTNFDPTRGILPNDGSIKSDLQVLREAGFDAIVTYGTDIMENITTLSLIADSLGFQAIILGVWDPTSEEEIAEAKSASQHDLVVGFCVGNEGLDRRYDLPSLTSAMKDLAKATHKPVTTTEEFEDYQKPQLLELSDWIFPNVHPYWHGITEPDSAAKWTTAQYQDLKTKTNKLIVFKEVGLPTAGDSRVSEEKQAEYYKLLKYTIVPFVYFEAFDQPWKIHAPVEPYWGLFKSDRSPKAAVNEVCFDAP